MKQVRWEGFGVRWGTTGARIMTVSFGEIKVQSAKSRSKGASFCPEVVPLEPPKRYNRRTKKHQFGGVCAVEEDI